MERTRSEQGRPAFDPGVWRSHHGVVLGPEPWTGGGATLAVRHPVGAALHPVLALTVLAAGERGGLGLDEVVPGAATSVAAALCAPDACALLPALVRSLTGRSPARAVEDLVTGPLGVDRELRVDGAEATAFGLGVVLRAWLRLSTGIAEPDLPRPDPATVRRAWATASRLERPGPGAPPRVARPRRSPQPRWSPLAGGVTARVRRACRRRERDRPGRSDRRRWSPPSCGRSGWIPTRSSASSTPCSPRPRTRANSRAVPRASA